jgi:flavodoxin
MKIAIVSKSDRIGGGASRVAEDLAAWLNDAGHQTDHFIAFNFKDPLSSWNQPPWKPPSRPEGLVGEEREDRVFNTGKHVRISTNTMTSGTMVKTR